MTALTDGVDGASAGIHPALTVAGASRGFTVLLLGGVVQPWVATLVPPLGYVWLAVVAVAAFAVAAIPRAARGVRPSPQRFDRAMVGTWAALGSYALVLPLVLSVADGVPVVQIACTTLLAVTVGSLVGGCWPARA